MRQIIINADDFGFSPEISQGILHAHTQGGVHATTALVNFPGIEKSFELLSNNTLDLGWHFNLSEGLPVCSSERVSSLVQNNGHFYPLPKLIERCILGKIQSAEVELELEAQWKIFEKYKKTPSHVDGHQHVHLLPVITKPFLEFIRQKKIPFVRLPLESGGSRFFARSFLKLLFFRQKKHWKNTSARILPFYGLSLGKNSDKLAAWEKLLQRIEEPIAEIMMHPGGLAEKDFNDPLRYQRVRELSFLCSSEFKLLLKKMDFTLTSFKNLL